MSFFTHIFLFVLFFSFSLYGSVGKVSLLRGEGFLERSGHVSPLQTGMKLEERDTLSTGANGQVQLIFDDKTVITLGNKAVFKVEEYVNEAVKPKAKFSFNQGTFKTITGKIGKTAPENFTLETKTATIGIRGTIIRGKIGRNEDKIMCEKGLISVRSHITGREVLLPMGRLIVLPHNAPPSPPRDVQSADLMELGLGGTPPPENPDGGSPSGGSSGDGSGSSGDSGSGSVPSGPTGDMPSGGVGGMPGGASGVGATGSSGGGFPTQVAPNVPQAALTALDTSYQTLQQDTVTQEILTQECPSGTTGTYPDCVALTCPSGTTGTYPDCVALTCPSGTTGTYPDCVAVYVPPTIYNASRDTTLSGNLVHHFENIGPFYGMGSGSYTLVQNTLSTQSGGNTLYFYDSTNTPISQPYDSRTVDWTVTLPNVEAGTTYSGFSNMGTISMAFSSPDGITTIADPASATLYGDNMQQFFVLHYSTSPNAVVAYESIFTYNEWFGTITPYTTLATLFPTREVVIYRSAADSTDKVTVNYGNNHFLAVNMTGGTNNNSFSIAVGRVEDHSNQTAIVGQEISGYYDFNQFEISTGISGYIYGDKAQGFGGSSLIQNGAGTSYNLGGIGAYRDTTLTTSDLTGDFMLSGYANVAKSDLSAYPATSSNFSFSINRDTGILGTSNIDLTAHNLGTVTFQDGTGAKSAYVNDDYFATLGTASGKGYLVALDTYPSATNDYVSWGYWGYTDDVNNPTFTVIPSTWVGGMENNASGHIASLIASGTTTSYTYNGHVIGYVNNGSGNYAMDTSSSENQVKLDFDFGGGTGSLKNTSYIQFKTTEPTPQVWKISPTGSVNSTGFSISNTDSVSWGGTLQSGSASTVSGQFYGPNAESVGGSFSATAGAQGAIGVFKGTR